MSGTDGAKRGVANPAFVRRQVINALDGEVMTGPAIFRRIRERSEEGSAASVGAVQPNDQSLFYPALHSLEADWKLQATWQSDASGANHRTYRRRRLLPRRPAWTIRT